MTNVLSSDLGDRVSPKLWPDVMIDNETLSLDANGVVVKTCFVAFDSATGEVGNHITIPWAIQEQLKQGREISASTLQWWLTEPSQGARDKVFDNSRYYFVEGGMHAIKTFFNCHIKPNARVWCHGVDIAWLRSLFEDRVPWNRRRIIDIHTLLCIKGKVDIGEFEGDQHDAYDDCVHQIKYCVEMRKQEDKWED